MISRRDLHERAVATPDTAADARSVVSVGVPVIGMEVRIVDERSRPLPPRHIGSIEVRGAAVSRGYLTENGWLDGPVRDGWLCTGDLGYLDEHGTLYVCGRAKDVIVIAGKNIYPTDIERAACAVSGVRAGNAAAVRIDAGDGRESFAVLAESAQAGDPAEAERIRAEIARRGQSGRRVHRARGAGAATRDAAQDAVGQAATPQGGRIVRPHRRRIRRLHRATGGTGMSIAAIRRPS